MLRALVLILALANAGYLAWSGGWIDGVAGGGQGDREPQRLQNQVRPDIVRILPPSAAGSGGVGAGGAGSGSDAGAAGAASPSVSRSGLDAAAPAPAAASIPAAAASTAAAVTTCIEAGPFSARQLVAAQGSLRAASVQPVAEVAVETPGVWMVYMGRYANHDAMLRKMEELRRRRLDYEEIKGLPDLEPGLSLGRYASRQAADGALAQAGQRNVRTARVVTVSPAATVHWLREADVTVDRRQQLLAVNDPALGEGFTPCGSPR